METQRLKPSNAMLWTRCPASVYFFRDHQKSDFTLKTGGKRFGIVAHLVAANILKGKCNPWENIKGKRLLKGVDRPAIERAALWYEHAIAIHVTDDMKTGIETTVKLESIIHQRNAIGKIDFVAYNDDQIMIFDYKHGEEKVTAKNNPQLWLYAAGMLNKLNNWNGDLISVFIIQPALRKISSQTLPTERVKKLAKSFERKANKALKSLQLPPEKATYKPCSACKRCNGFGRCLVTAPPSSQAFMDLKGNVYRLTQPTNAEIIKALDGVD